VRACDSVRSVVVITTDKCYENKEWVWAYRETDRLGGFDPYSSSKACAELVVSAYRSSFFPSHRRAEHGVALASTRAGNVIGGGDWAKDRLIPDIMRAFTANKVLTVRSPGAARPWQYVLEPLRGYLMLAEKLYEGGIKDGGGWNFGPEYRDAKPVAWIVRRLAGEWPGARWELDGAEHPHEAQTLRLDWSKAFCELHWAPVLSLEQALVFTADWYRAWQHGDDMQTFTCHQIEQYIRLVEQDANSTTAPNNESNSGTSSADPQACIL
jgi:CDP-glucose 4,6-dehydratase